MFLSVPGSGPQLGNGIRGSLSAAKEKGYIRSEGKEYVMQDGDVVNFLFNV